MKTQQQIESDIYKAFVRAKQNPKQDITALCKRLKISRQHLYNVVKRVRKGDTVKIKLSMEASRLETLWKHKYMSRFLSIPNDRRPETMLELKRLISDMKKDDFPVTEISDRLRKDRSTVLYHLAK